MSIADVAVSRLLPEPSDRVDLARAYAFPEPLSRPWVRANMVSSADGGAWDHAGRSEGLSSPADRAIMATLRGLCDVILVGAGTARHEGYRPVRPRELWAKLREGRPATPRVAVVTRSLDLHPDLLNRAPEDAPTLVFTTERAARERPPAARSAELVVAGETSVEPEAVVAGLAERGLLRVLCEGGPRLLARIWAADLLDELCLTLSPVMIGTGAARILAGSPPAPGAAPEELRTAQVLAHDGSLFLRYLTPRGAAL